MDKKVSLTRNVAGASIGLMLFAPMLLATPVTSCAAPNERQAKARVEAALPLLALRR